MRGAAEDGLKALGYDLRGRKIVKGVDGSETTEPGLKGTVRFRPTPQSLNADYAQMKRDMYDALQALEKLLRPEGRSSNMSKANSSHITVKGMVVNSDTQERRPVLTRPRANPRARTIIPQSDLKVKNDYKEAFHATTRTTGPHKVERKAQQTGAMPSKSVLKGEDRASEKRRRPSKDSAMGLGTPAKGAKLTGAEAPYRGRERVLRFGSKTGDSSES
jgi:hypothetical protein